MKLSLFAVVFLVSNVVALEDDPAYWRNLAKENIQRYSKLQPNTGIAKNIVLLIGGGMGLSTVMAARTLKGQMQGRTGEETELNFEKFPYTALSKPYSLDYQVPEAAATTTAIVSGVKVKSRTLGVDGKVTLDKCMDLTNHKLSNIRHWSEAAGKISGFVTTARVTYATPAALYAASTNRDWESDITLPESSEPHCTDMASQLVYNASSIRVMLGGGSRNFIPNDTADPITGVIDAVLQRRDGKNLLQEWMQEKNRTNSSYKFVHNAEQLQGVDPASTDYLLGLFNTCHMSYEADRNTTPAGEPSLKDMTRKAIQILSRNEKGFFLMVEGARIDHAHHEVLAKKSLVDTLAFEDAVQTVLDMTNETETLVIVTADHSHTLTVSGYPGRGNGILDIVKDAEGDVTYGNDSKPYTTLTYANGPNHQLPRPNLTDVDTTVKEFRQHAGVPLKSETHSGEDIAIYSRGPMAHLLTGVKEQNVIAYVMAHAACIGDTGIPCETGREKYETCAATELKSKMILLLALFYTYYLFSL